jgi:hypothetical protein
VGAGLVGTAAIANLVEVTGSWGIEVPAVPALLRLTLEVRSDWHWGTEEFDLSLHHFDDTYVRWLLEEWDRRPLYLFSLSGYGENSHTVNATVSLGSVAVYVTSGFGGIYMEPRLHAARANCLFRRVDSLTRGLRVAEPVRWLVVSGHFRTGCLLVDLDEFDRVGYPDGFMAFTHDFDPEKALPWQRRDDDELFSDAHHLLDLPSLGPFVQPTVDPKVVGAMVGMPEDEPIIDTWLLRRLETQMGVESAFGTAEIAGARWGFCEDDDEAVLLRMASQPSDLEWDEIERFETFADLLRGVGPRFDEQWDKVPVDDPDKPRPIVVLAEERGVLVLHRTPEGVQSVEELAEKPGKLIVHHDVRQTFTEALNWQADNSEIRS